MDAGQEKHRQLIIVLVDGEAEVEDHWVGHWLKCGLNYPIGQQKHLLRPPPRHSNCYQCHRKSCNSLCMVFKNDVQKFKSLSGCQETRVWKTAVQIILLFC